MKGSRDKGTVKHEIKSCYNMNMSKQNKVWSNLDMRKMHECGRVDLADNGPPERP